MVLGTVVDLSVLSYLLLVIMKEWSAVVGRGGAHPQTSDEAEPALSHRARQSLSLDVGRGRARPRTPGEAEPALGGWARRNQSSVARTRSVVAFLSDRKRQRSMVIISTLLGTPVLGL